MVHPLLLKNIILALPVLKTGLVFRAFLGSGLSLDDTESDLLRTPGRLSDDSDFTAVHPSIPQGEGKPVSVTV
jgi:hypothetical protein